MHARADGVLLALVADLEKCLKQRRIRKRCCMTLAWVIAPCSANMVKGGKLIWLKETCILYSIAKKLYRKFSLPIVLLSSEKSQPNPHFRSTYRNFIGEPLRLANEITIGWTEVRIRLRLFWAKQSDRQRELTDEHGGHDEGRTAQFTIKFHGENLIRTWKFELMSKKKIIQH